MFYALFIADSYWELHQWSCDHYETFWEAVLRFTKIILKKRYTKVGLLNISRILTIKLLYYYVKSLVVLISHLLSKSFFVVSGNISYFFWL